MFLEGLSESSCPVRVPRLNVPHRRTPEQLKTTSMATDALVPKGPRRQQRTLACFKSWFLKLPERKF